MAAERRSDDELVERALEGHVASMARLISRLESRGADGDALLARMHAESGNAHVIGITGARGQRQEHAGQLAREGAAQARPHGRHRRGRPVELDHRRRDPRRPHPDAGARARPRHLRALDVHARLARAAVSRATIDAVTVLDAAGRDVVIIETVGVGQDEVDVVQAAHTVAVVSVPGMGDDIQAIKAGLLEVADLHVVNKADRPGHRPHDLRAAQHALADRPAARGRLGAADPAHRRARRHRASPSSSTPSTSTSPGSRTAGSWSGASTARPPRASRPSPRTCCWSTSSRPRPATRSSAPSTTSSTAAPTPAPPGGT